MSIFIFILWWLDKKMLKKNMSYIQFYNNKYIDKRDEITWKHKIFASATISVHVPKQTLTYYVSICLAVVQCVSNNKN